MNKVEYLDALKASLKDTDKDVMEEIIADYEEHFQVGAENGKTEEQICEDLGSIEDLVQEIKEVYNTGSNSERKEEKASNDEGKSANKGKFFGEWNFSFDNINGESISNAINSALNTAGEALSNIDVKEFSKNVKKTVEDAASSINNFADDYLKNQGNPFDFGKRRAEGFKENTSKSYDDSEPVTESNVSYDTESDAAGQREPEAKEAQMEEQGVKEEAPVKEESAPVQEEVKEEVPVEDMEAQEVPEASEAKEEEKDDASKQLNLVIDGICADVNVRKSMNGKLNINYENNGNERQKQMYEFYSYKEGNTVHAGIRKVGKAVFFFNFAANSIKINVELPEYMGTVTIKTASGDIQLDDAVADRIVLDTASGDIEVNQMKATDCRMKSSSGDFELNDINVIQLYAGTNSGDVEAVNVTTQNMTLKSTSGDLEAKDVNASIVDISSTSGDLEVVHVKANDCKIRSISGDIEIDDFSMNNSDVSSMSGNLKLTGVLGDALRAVSTSGDVDVNVNVKRCHASSKSGDVDVIANGDLTLESSSTSGDVSVHLKNYGNGYNVTSRTTSGGLYINYEDQHYRNLKTGNYTFGKMSSELILSSVSGDIRLND